jgi:hypothetical protein
MISRRTAAGYRSSTAAASGVDSPAITVAAVCGGSSASARNTASGETCGSEAAAAGGGGAAGADSGTPGPSSLSSRLSGRMKTSSSPDSASTQIVGASSGTRTAATSGTSPYAG